MGHLRDSGSMLCASTTKTTGESRAHWKSRQNLFGEAKSILSSTAAMDFIPEISRFITFSQYLYSAGRKDVTPRWGALVELMQRPWFSRFWVMKDIAVARESSVHCGNNVVHWVDLADTIALCYTRPNRKKQCS